MFFLIGAALPRRSGGMVHYVWSARRSTVMYIPLGNPCPSQTLLHQPVSTSELPVPRCGFTHIFVRYLLLVSPDFYFLFDCQDRGELSTALSIGLPLVVINFGGDL